MNPPAARTARLPRRPPRVTGATVAAAATAAVAMAAGFFSVRAGHPMHRVLGPRALSLGQRGAWQTRAISEKITFPALSPTMTEGRVAQWKKAVGDKIRPGDILASVETDKATLDWEWAGDEGYIAQVAAQPEGAVKVGAEIGVWVETEEELAEGGRLVLGAPSGGAAPPPAAAASVAAPAPPAAAPAAPPVSPALRGIVERSGPAVQKLFHDSRDVDLSDFFSNLQRT
jgi:biotin carboxyl carrier protein